MKLNSKVTWGLAWTGLAVVLAVPSADYLTGRLGGGGKADAATVLTSDIEPVTPAVTTIKTKNGVTIVPAGSKLPAADPVDKLLSSGKTLPAYINDGDEPAAASKPTQIASLPEPVTAPTPFPSWARPKAAPAPAMPEMTTAPAVTQPTPVIASTTAPGEPTPLIVDERTLTGSIQEPTPVPPSPMVDDSANWDELTLRQYLQRRGILEGGDETRSTATVNERDSNYDPDGFYLNEGPNGVGTNRETRRERILRMLEEEDPDSFTLF